MSKEKVKMIMVVADYHKELAEQMVEIATNEIERAQAELLKVINVPGSYEIPLAVKAVIEKGEADAVVALGYIERGYTLHGEVMGQVVHGELIKIQLKHNMPMGIGIIGPGATRKQAEERKKRAAAGAVRAALTSYKVLHDIMEG